MTDDPNPESANMVGDDSTRLSVMLREYDAAQGSAQHYNSLLWQVISIFTAANAVLLAGTGSVLVIGVENLRWGIALAVSLVGIVMNVACLRFVFVFRSFQNQKLDRCRALEQSIERLSRVPVNQHSALRQYPGVHRFWYNTLQGSLLLAWSALLAAAIRYL